MSASTLPPRFTFGPDDTLGNAIFYRYYPYQATLARWDRASAEAAANPYTVRLQLLQQQLETERTELMQMMRVLASGQTPMEARQEAEARAALARSGRRGGGGGGRGGIGPMEKLKALDIASGIVSEAGGTVLRAPGMNLRAGTSGVEAPSDATVRFNSEAATQLQAATPDRRYAIAQQLAADARIAPVKASEDGSTPVSALAAAHQMVLQGVEPDIAATVWGVPADYITREGFAEVKAALSPGAGVQAPSTDPLAAPLAEEAARLALEAARGGGGGGGGRGGGGAGGAVEAQVDPSKVLSDAERRAVERYIRALADDGVATAEEYGEGFAEGEAAYFKAADLGEYTSVQAPYFNPEFLNRLGSVARVTKAEAEQRGKFLEREERTPEQIDREQARLFLEEQYRAKGLAYFDQQDYPDVEPWRLDTWSRALRILRDEGVEALAPVGPVEPGAIASPAEYGRMLEAMQENGAPLTGARAREMARKKFKNDARAEEALDYFFAAHFARQQKERKGTRVLDAEAAAKAATEGAKRKSPWDTIEAYEALEEQVLRAAPERSPEERRMYPPPQPEPVPAPEEDIVFRNAPIEIVSPQPGDEMLNLLRTVPNPSATVGLSPRAETALREQERLRQLVIDEELRQRAASPPPMPVR